jgi:Parvulin-like peptidyl-prolyl isomerase
MQKSFALKNAGEDEEDIDRPFLMRDISMFGIQLPISLMTILIFTISVLLLFSNFQKHPAATASHILIDDHSDGTRDKLIKMKQDIGNDKQKFAKYAVEYSKCPSGKSSGGSLGKFGMGSMVPPFDRAVFDPNNKVGEVLGPVQTQFGWHLILVHERSQ